MKRYFIFGMAIIVLLLVSIDATATAVALPVMTSSFGASLILAAWVLSGYQLALIVAMPLAGKISDTFGRKFTFMAYLALFTVSSLLCSIATNIYMLIAFRVIQGIGGSGFIPSASGIVANEFPHSRQQALGLFTSIVPIGQIIGPNLGGWMTSAFGWRSIFWINIPLGIIALAASMFLLTETTKEETSLDLIGTALMVGMLGGFFMALSNLGKGDIRSSWMQTAALLVVSGVCGFFFVRRENKVKDPVIDIEVMKERPFIAANVYNFIFGCIFGALALIPLYVVSSYGMSTMASGFILTPRSLGMMVAATVTSLYLVRWGYRGPMLVGTIFMLPAFLLLVTESAGFSLFHHYLGHTALMLVIMGMVGLGMGVTAPASNNACIELMPQRISTIVAIRAMVRQIGSIFSINIGSLLLHNLGMAVGFRVFFLGIVFAMVTIMIPSIFYMPKSAQQT